MFRKNLIDLLRNNPMSVTQIAREAGVKASEVVADLQHLQLSLRHTEEQLAVTPARCRKCGFQFDSTKLSKPSRCPECRATWLTEPRVQIVPRK